MTAAMKREGGAEKGGVSDSLIRIEIITHFHRNPGLTASPEELSRAMGRDPSRVERQVRKLVELNILAEMPGNGKGRYQYLPPYSVAAFLLRSQGR